MPPRAAATPSPPPASPARAPQTPVRRFVIIGLLLPWPQQTHDHERSLGQEWPERADGTGRSWGARHLAAWGARHLAAWVRPAGDWPGDAMTVAVRVIPCLDVDAGRVVKGVNFRDLRDAGDPVELAAAYDAEGADELVFLDITASSGGRETMVDVVGRTADQVFIPLTVGGGVRSVADVDRLLRAGADKVSLNTAAIARPALLAEAAHQFGSQCVVLSVDARRVDDGARLRGDHARGTPGHRDRRGDVGGPRGGAGRRRDPAQLHGRGRHQGGLRHRTHPRGARGRERAHHCQRRGRRARALRPRGGRRCRRRAGGQRVPLRPAADQ